MILDRPKAWPRFGMKLLSCQPVVPATSRMRLAVLKLAPHNTSGYNVCPFASPGCVACCAALSWRGGTRAMLAAKTRRTEMFFKSRGEFTRKLRRDIDNILRAYSWESDYTYAVQLNYSSDIAWEAVMPWLFEYSPALQFFDFTMSPVRYNRFLTRSADWPSAYHLTFSRNDRNEDVCIDFLKRGGTAAIVIRGIPVSHWPTEYMGFPIINPGDSKERWLDPGGAWIGLPAAGNATSDRSGFAARFDALREQLIAEGVIESRKPMPRVGYLDPRGLYLR